MQASCIYCLAACASIRGARSSVKSVRHCITNLLIRQQIIIIVVVVVAAAVAAVALAVGVEVVVAVDVAVAVVV